ncbi:MAG: hypothetical protein MJ089_08355 [Ruminococcus sp.]|nr:hypothetical protein [Ruminococcus sp.]
MDSFISDKKDSAIKVLDEYNMDFAKQSIFELTTYHNNDFSENELCEIKNFFEYYIYLIENSKFNQAICMLMLYSLINVNIVYIKEYFHEKVQFNSIEEDKINAETEYVISSALNQNIFLR